MTLSTRKYPMENNHAPGAIAASLNYVLPNWAEQLLQARGSSYSSQKSFAPRLQAAFGPGSAAKWVSVRTSCRAETARFSLRAVQAISDCTGQLDSSRSGPSDRQKWDTVLIRISLDRRSASIACTSARRHIAPARGKSNQELPAIPDSRRASAPNSLQAQCLPNFRPNPHHETPEHLRGSATCRSTPRIGPIRAVRRTCHPNSLDRLVHPSLPLDRGHPVHPERHR
jgi:hypothetical protein